MRRPKLSKLGAPKNIGRRVRHSNIVAMDEPREIRIGLRVANDLFTSVGAPIVLGSRDRIFVIGMV